MFAASGFMNLRICCFSLSFVIVNEESLGFRLLAGQTKPCEDATLASGKLLSAFFTSWTFVRHNNLSINCENDIYRDRHVININRKYVQ